MSRTPKPPDRNTPPTVQRLRFRYAKRGRLRFTSHRDFQRALERAVRRAGVPIAYSAGFSPHPKISYAGAAPTGAASEAEYAELGVAVRCDPQALRTGLDAALPDGLDVLEVVEAGPGALADRLQASFWEIACPLEAADDLAAAVEAFLARDVVEVERLTKNGLRVFDIRDAVRRLDLARPEPAGGAPSGGATDLSIPCAILQVVVRHGTPAVRPDDVLAGLRLASGLELPPPHRMTRRSQGPWDEESGTVGDPLAPDRDASVTS
ncbi:TIGR03936 family radical SAM-associated protein [Actinopolymorpha rutila]|uniref:Radical SAM-linked protein n=1 Tax=Actinopolymorpha rutila TaxID=446787 RepID=A0A852ZJ42_9ACTN|nr:TIGR03936 family radical SAM-associated protein [Actinopolymorpha rutila]NYH89160.1 radical SAM-linked protein [Actinopolymorpha rutila]